SIRARGARVTDIAVIVVAADDGIMPQTVEAINHAKDAGVPIIIAINKIDLPNSNPSKIKKDLTEYNLVTEEWGGDTICIEISAKKKTNLDEFLEMIY
ncbi:MAG: GTP-binding protein, partial [Actinobacteria bacterium]|nr:GTP-binding protein [Actinomycetota bacterium]